MGLSEIQAQASRAFSRLRWAAWPVLFALGYGLAQVVDGVWIPDRSGSPAVDLAIGLAIGLMIRAPRRVFLWLVAVQVVLCLPLAWMVPHPAAPLSWLVHQVAPAVTVALIMRGVLVVSLKSVARLGLLLGVVVGSTLVWALGLSLVTSVVDGWHLPDSTWVWQWWSQTLGALLVAPGVLAIRRPVGVTRRRLIEALMAAAVAIPVAAIVLSSQYEQILLAWSAQYLLIPVFLWIALRFGLAMVSGAMVLVNVGALVATANGVGPFAAADPAGAALALPQLSAALIGVAVYAVAINEERRRLTENRLLAARGVVDSLLANSDARISVKQYDEEGRGKYALANPRFAGSIRRAIPQIVGRSDAELFKPETAAREEAEDRSVLASRSPRVFMTRRTDAGAERDGQILLVTKFPLADAEGRMRSVGAIALDITEHRRRERLMRLTFDQSPIPMARLAWRSGRAGEVLDANRPLAELLGIPVPDLTGARLDRFVHPDERGVEIISPVGGTTSVRSREIRIVTADADERWVLATASVVEPDEDDGLEEAFALLTLEDVTARRTAEQTLTHQALHDALTGVLNRYALLDRLGGALSRLWREPGYVAVLFCDLDGFKHLNDTLGHRAGDQMLVSVSQRLRAVISPHDTVARLGGDEFVLVCEDLSTPGQASVIGERIRAAIRAPFPIDGREYGMTVSVGIAATTDPKTQAEDLLRRADLAMYRAKDAGRNRVEYYAAELEARAVAQVETTEALRRAIDHDRICVHYQPIIDLRTGRAIAVEALVRMVGDDGDLVRPSVFIDVAERSGLVVPMGERVLDLALDELSRWQEAGLDLSLAVNVSPRQLNSAGFAPAVFERLLERGLSPGSLTLEVTEGAVVDATGPTLLTLRRLRSYGVHVGIDDFGTGYSSLTTLKHLPADVLKIDRSFVEGLGNDPKDAAIVSAVVRVAHETGKAVVAEGVENDIQEEALRRMSCDRVQGFRYGRPVSASELRATAAR